MKARTAEHMKEEIESLKKIWIEVKLEMENLGSQPHQQKTGDGRISDTKDKRKETDTSVKENVKHPGNLEHWETKLWIIGIEEGKEIQVKGTGNFFFQQDHRWQFP